MGSRRGRRRHPLYYQEADPAGGGPIPGTHASSHESGGSDALDLGQLAGTLVNAQVPVGVITQHEGSLTIDWSQLTSIPSEFTPTDHDIISKHTASGLTEGHVIRATGATTFAFQQLNFSDLAGSIADGQVPQSAVTQHEGALSIAWSQITGEPTTLAGYGITDAYTQSYIDANFAPISHSHGKDDLPSATAYRDEPNTFVNTVTVQKDGGDFLVFSDTTAGILNAMKVGVTVDGTRLWFAPAPGGTPDWTREFSFDFTNDYWIFDDDLVVGGALSVGGVSSNLNFSGTNAEIRSDTSDGSDVKRIRLSGGGAAGAHRGAYINLMGNEYSGQEGDIAILAGYSGVPDHGSIDFYTGNTQRRARILNSGTFVIFGDLYAQSGTLEVGEHDATPGELKLRAAASGPEGGQISFEVSPDYDTNVAFFYIDAWQDRLRFFADGDVFAYYDDSDDYFYFDTDVVRISGLTRTYRNSDEQIRIEQQSATGSPYVSIYQSGTRRAYLQWSDVIPDLRIVTEESGSDIRFYPANTLALRLRNTSVVVDVGYLIIDGNYNDAVAAGAVGISESGGGLYLGARAQVVVDIDNDNNASDRFFQVRKDRTTEVFRVNENGTVVFNNAYTFPSTDGSANQVLKTDGAGSLSWVTQAGDTGNLEFSGYYLQNTVTTQYTGIAGSTSGNGGNIRLYGPSGDDVIIFRQDATEIARFDSDGYLDVVGKVRAQGLEVDGDITGASSGVVRFTNTTYGVSTGTGTVKMQGATNRDSVGWLKVYINGTICHIPYWTVIT